MSEWLKIGSEITGENSEGYSDTSVSISDDDSIVAIGAYRNGAEKRTTERSEKVSFSNLLKHPLTN